MCGFFEDDINYYIEMMSHGASGRDLFDYIEHGGSKTESNFKSIFVQVARAVLYLHTEMLIVHRDIKDENVIIYSDGLVKLIDFGSAAFINDGPFDVFLGTITYAAPEIITGKFYNGKEQDVWALGILLYTLLYGVNPFQSAKEIGSRSLAIPHVLSNTSLGLIQNMLTRNVKSRFTIEEVLDHT
ncbi:uncharacterized protein RAG0_02947 [Rhynchosporium agropyri]|uniref:Protein kinase domain-containing protein n=1 Tax=Rhynchosporium agropyri TaxID=914238 RepID=A0A1E1K2S5_9HELO|nr:uncharacterized protein RAG0_02947 [Rhynchosporium agropyri]